MERLDGVADAFVLRGALTAAECAEWTRAATDSGFARSGGWTFFAGDRERSTVTDARMADTLWSRLAPHVGSRVHDAGASDHSFSGRLADIPSGTYDPVGLASFLRFSRYAPGGSFATHTDTCLASGPDYTGLMTVLVYLNDDFDGGGTLVHRDGERSGEPPIRIRPETSKALVFYHYRRHAGEAVSGGVKHVARTEVMFACRRSDV